MRNLLNDRNYAALSIAGLAISISVSLALSLFIYDEVSYDKYHKNARNIYRIVTNIKESENSFTWPVAQVPLAEELLNRYPEIENAVRFHEAGSGFFKYKEKQFYEEKFFLCDSSVFEMFSYEFVAGSPYKALDNPYSIVLTETIARKYFDYSFLAINQTIENAHGESFQVTGVVKDVPLNSHFRFDALISKNTLNNIQGDWSSFGVYTYIQLPVDYPLSKMANNLRQIEADIVNKTVSNKGISVQYQLQKITDIHLYSKIEDELEASGDILYVYIAATVAILILFTGCVNYVNLTTARSINRSKEIGLRKVLGVYRYQLIGQFIAESLIVASLSLFLGLFISFFIIPEFSSLVGKQFSAFQIFRTPVFLFLMFATLFIGIVGGLYPAFYLSNLDPISTLKGKYSINHKSHSIRKLLIIFQFGISFLMLVSTLLVQKQLSFIQNKDLGFNKNNLVRIDVVNLDQQSRIPVLTNKLSQLSFIIDVGYANTAPGKRIGKLLFEAESNNGNLVSRSFNLFVADYNFVQTLGIKIVSGRNFSRDFISDTINAVLVNEALVKSMGWIKPVNKRLIVDELNPVAGRIEKQVVGVIGNYNQNSLYNAIEPLIIILGRGTKYVFVRLKEGDTNAMISEIESAWSDVFPKTAFEYNFITDDLVKKYGNDINRGRILSFFSFVALLISSIGLLGLTAYMTRQRAKEISIRKVFGSSKKQIVILLTKEIYFLLVVSYVLSMPFACYVTNEWLNSFAYRINLIDEWLTLVFAGVTVVSIATLTLIYYIEKVTRTNPAEVLRDE